MLAKFTCVLQWVFRYPSTALDALWRCGAVETGFAGTQAIFDLEAVRSSAVRASSLEMKRDKISEGLADYALAREEADAREEMIRWSARVADPCCRDCGFLIYARQELIAALRRARAAGVFAEQAGEAEWLTRHRIECPLDVE